MDKLKLVAHRGYAAKYPENTLEALQAAMDLGAEYVELDVQLSADFVPVIVHDDNLLRCSGIDMPVMETAWSELKLQTAGEPERFAGEFNHVRLPALQGLVELLSKRPKVTAFVEIKEESLARFGTDFTVARVLDTLAEVLDQCTIISFDADAVACARRLRGVPIGWVMHRHDADALARAESLKPEILISNYTKIDNEPAGLWPGPWHWFVYEIIDPALALHWYQRGVAYVESEAIGELLAAAELT